MAQQAQHSEDEVAYYYDLHPTKEDKVGETAVHAALVHYLIEVLSWLFREQRCTIYEKKNTMLMIPTSRHSDAEVCIDCLVGIWSESKVRCVRWLSRRMDICGVRTWKAGWYPTATIYVSLTPWVNNVSLGLRHWRRSCAHWE
jgi:hypothetical protein